MKKYNLCDIADGKIPIPSEKCDVHCGEYDEKMMRRVNRVEWITKKNDAGGKKYKWLYMWWEPEVKDSGRIDCGYSGFREDLDGITELCLIGDSHE